MITINYKKFPAAGWKTINLNSTTFPDGTTQVWKLDEMPFGIVDVLWQYENELELIKIMQLGLLFKHESVKSRLIVPYLPYSRQDKDVSNESCFAKATLKPFIENYENVIVSDVHSDAWNYIHKGLLVDAPTGYFRRAIHSIGVPVTVVFPDQGAYNRYGNDPALLNLPYVVINKTRDQLTGKITSIYVDKITTDGTRVLPKDYLIVDDISDYGGTFLGVAKALINDLEVNSISLYVTHFLGHGEIDRFYNAGIKRIYTTDSLTAYRASKEQLTVNPQTKLEVLGSYKGNYE